LESSDGKENLNSRCVADSRVLVVATEAASVRSGEKTMHLEGLSHFSSPKCS
jgi:hypothetical protein